MNAYVNAWLITLEKQFDHLRAIILNLNALKLVEISYISFIIMNVYSYLMPIYLQRRINVEAKNWVKLN